MHLTPDFHIGLRLALRARFVSISFWLLITLAIVVLLAAQFSGRQPATVALDVGLSAIRLALPLLIVLMVQELISREFDRRYFLTSLTYPRPRHQFLLGRLLALFSLIFSLLIAMAVVLGGLVWFIAQGYAQATPVALDQHYLITLAFLSVDLFVVTVMATLFAIVASTPSFILIGTLGFVIVARSYSTIIALLGREYDIVAKQELYQESLGLLAYLLPDLAALDVRMITLYGTMNFLPGNWPTLLISTLAYAIALIAVAILFLQRKRFS